MKIRTIVLTCVEARHMPTVCFIILVYIFKVNVSALPLCLQCLWDCLSSSPYAVEEVVTAAKIHIDIFCKTSFYFDVLFFFVFNIYIDYYYYTIIFTIIIIINIQPCILYIPLSPLKDQGSS